MTEHLDKNECVYKLSSSVKTNRGVGKIALTQKRLFLLTEGRPGYVEISTFRNIEVRGSQPSGTPCSLHNSVRHLFFSKGGPFPMEEICPVAVTHLKPYVQEAC